MRRNSSTSALPRFFSRGLIEAPPNRWVAGLALHFRGFLAAASLKLCHWIALSFHASFAYFRGFLAAASLKLDTWEASAIMRGLLPRFFSRGLIEAITVESG